MTDKQPRRARKQPQEVTQEVASAVSGQQETPKQQPKNPDRQTLSNGLVVVFH